MFLTIASVAASLVFAAPQQVPAASGATHAAPVASATLRADSIQGRILTADGLPVADATVSVVLSGTTDAIRTARTAADGSYTLAMPSAPGNYMLRIRCLGYSPVVLAVTRQGGSWNVPAEMTMTPIAVNLTPVPGAK